MLGWLAANTGEPRPPSGPDPTAQVPVAQLPPPDKIILGLDLGEVKDPTALAALHVTRRPNAGGQLRRHYACRLLVRWPLRTGYESIIEDVGKIAQGLPLTPELVIDGTGAGRAVAQMFRRAKLPVKSFVPVIITAGTKVLQEPDGYWHVAKAELVSIVLAVMQSGRLKVSPHLKECKTLIRELQTFRRKVNVATGNESFEAWRERAHDDTVLATALALWWGEYFGKQLDVSKWF